MSVDVAVIVTVIVAVGDMVDVIVAVDDIVGVASAALQQTASSVTQQGTSSSAPNADTWTQPASRSSAVTGPSGWPTAHRAWPAGAYRKSVGAPLSHDQPTLALRGAAGDDAARPIHSPKPSSETLDVSAPSPHRAETT